MASEVITLADSLTTLLTAQVTAAEGTIARDYVPQFELAETAALQVMVVPAKNTSEQVDRTRWQHDYEIHIGIMQRAAAKADIDAKMDFVRDMHDYLKTHKPTSPAVGLVSLVNDPIYIPDHLIRLKQFTSVLKVVYREIR